MRDKGAQVLGFNASQKNNQQEMSIQKKKKNQKNTAPERNEGKLELFHLRLLAQHTHTNPSLLIYYY